MRGDLRQYRFENLTENEIFQKAQNVRLKYVISSRKTKTLRNLLWSLSVAVSTFIIYTSFQLSYWIFKGQKLQLLSIHPYKSELADQMKLRHFQSWLSQMIRLVEGRENNFRTDELCDDKLRENEVSSTKESAQTRTHENPALLPGTSSSCRRNEMTDSGSNFPTCRSKIMSEGSYPTSGDHRRYRENLRIARKMPRMPRSSMYVIFIMILSLLSTVGLVLAIFTSMKVAKLENSSLHAASCDKGILNTKLRFSFIFIISQKF